MSKLDAPSPPSLGFKLKVTAIGSYKSSQIPTDDPYSADKKLNAEYTRDSDCMLDDHNAHTTASRTNSTRVEMEYL